jgi:hypothetical protein
MGIASFIVLVAQTFFLLQYQLLVSLLAFKNLFLKISNSKSHPHLQHGIHP